MKISNVLVAYLVLGVEGCIDTNGNRTDIYNDGCAFYDDNPHDCGGYDDDDFTSNAMCCACGGGEGGECTITDSNLNTYVDAWVGGSTNPGGCGHISGWDVSWVTSLDGIFCGCTDSTCHSACSESKKNFNADLSSWNVARVSSLHLTFWKQ